MKHLRRHTIRVIEWTWLIAVVALVSIAISVLSYSVLFFGWEFIMHAIRH